MDFSRLTNPSLAADEHFQNGSMPNGGSKATEQVAAQTPNMLHSPGISC